MYVKNDTPFKFLALPGYDKDCRDVITNIVKGTFSIHALRSLKIAEEQVEIVMADEFLGETGVSPVRLESDLAIFKPFTDLILIGYAHDYKGNMIDAQEVTFGGGARKKKAVVRCTEAVERIPLHLLECFGQKMEILDSKRIGNGFGFFPRQYEPRCRFAGTYDDRWKTERAPFLPGDFDYRYFQAAYPELVSGSHFRGRERVFAENVSLSGPISVDLPGITPSVKTVFDRTARTAPAVLDTVILEPEEARLALVWRQMVPCHGMVKDVRGFEISLRTE
jgi:hypothetical protein